MAWNPNLDVLSGILGDARQYVDQHTREKKAASIKDLDRLYAEKMLGEQRDYNEEMLLDQQRIAQENAMRNLRQEILAKAGGFSGMGFSPDEEGRVSDLYEEQKTTAATLAAAELADLQAATLLKGRMPAKAAGRSSGMTESEYRQQIYDANPLDSRGHKDDYTHQETVNRFASELSGPEGPIQIDLSNDRVNQAFRRVIGTEKAVWNQALNVLRKDEDKAIPLFRAIKLWESNEAPAAIQGRMANVKTILSDTIRSEFMRQLAENEEYGWAASYIEKQLGPHSEVLFNRIVNSMMYIPSTGKIVMSPAGQAKLAYRQQQQPTQGETAQDRLLRNTRGGPAAGGVTPAAKTTWGDLVKSGVGLEQSPSTPLPPQFEQWQGTGGGLFGPNMGGRVQGGDLDELLEALGPRYTRNTVLGR